MCFLSNTRQRTYSICTHGKDKTHGKAWLCRVLSSAHGKAMLCHVLYFGTRQSNKFAVCFFTHGKVINFFFSHLELSFRYLMCALSWHMAND